MECSHGIVSNGTCVCYAGWSGKSDILNFDGVDCQTPVLLERILWSLVVLGNIKLFADGIKAVKSQYPVFLRKKESIARKGVSYSWFEYHPFQNLLLAMISVPLISLMSLPKVLNLENRVIGKDLLTSIPFVIVVPLAFMNNISVELRTFDAMTGTISTNKDDLQKLRKRMSFMYWFATSVYSTVTAAVVLAGCLMPNYDPRSGFMPYAVVVRNLSVVMYMFWVYKINNMVKNQVESLFAVLSSQGTRSSQASKLEKFLAFIKASAEGKRKVTVVAGGIYLLFIIPALWGHQQICISVISFLTVITKGHPVRTYIVRGENGERSNKITPDMDTSSKMDFTSTSGSN